MKLVIIGLGYSAETFVREYRGRFSRIVGTRRGAAAARALDTLGIDGRQFSQEVTDPRLAGEIAAADALIVSVPPGADGDPALRAFGASIAASSSLKWIGYLSTVGVYGDHDGGWVDEATAATPLSARSRERLAAEDAWAALARQGGRTQVSLRLSGIYGPGRNPLRGLREGTARPIDKPGQVFNRIHVADIAGALAACLDRPELGGPLNVTDDEPTAPGVPILHAARLLGLPPPAVIPFAAADLSPMGRSFYAESKRVANRRLRQVFGYRLRFPSYREGLAALSAAGEGAPAAPET